MTTLDQIIDAINSRRVISYEYGKHERVVIPTAVGRKLSTGNELVRVQQIGGTSSSSPIPPFATHIVANIVDLAVTDESFTDAPKGYVRDDSGIDIIYAQL